MSNFIVVVENIYAFYRTLYINLMIIIFSDPDSYDRFTDDIK